MRARHPASMQHEVQKMKRVQTDKELLFDAVKELVYKIQNFVTIAGRHSSLSRLNRKYFMTGNINPEGKRDSHDASIITAETMRANAG